MTVPVSVRTATWLLPLACIVSSGAAAAQEVSPGEHEAAVTNFQAGRRFVEQGNCKDAIPRFVESLRHEQNTGARFNLAECSRSEQRTAEAWNQFKLAEQIAAQKHDTERRDAAQKAIAELEPKVAKIRVSLPEDVSDLVVKLDGRVVASVDYALLAAGYAIEPGQVHRLDVTARNRAPWTKGGVQAGAGAELPPIAVDLGPPLEAEGSAIGAGQRMAGLIVGGVGVAGLAVGGVFGLLAMSAKSDAKTACETAQPGQSGQSLTYPKLCATDVGSDRNATVDSKTSTAKSDGAVSTVAFIAGAALVAGGAVLYLTAPKAPSTQSARIRLTPLLAPGLGGAMVGGTF